jgi:hypothetical protein
MSEATLKRKSKVLYNNLSVGMKQFSLNGTRRSQGYIGRGVLGLHFPKTPMRGNEPRGSGGCCGTYKRGPIVYDDFCFPSNNGMTANNNPAIVKKSVLDTNGQLMTQYRWIRRPAPYAVVKPDANMIQSTQSQYVENLSKKTIASLENCDKTGVCKPYVNKCGGLTIDQRPRPFNCVIRIPRGWYSITKTAANSPALGPIPQSEFIKALGGLCTKNDVLPKTSTNNGALPGPPASY